METESILILVGASAAVVYAIYKRYLMADDVVEFVEDAKEIVESMPSKSALMKMTKPELVEFAQEHGVDVAGTKSAIVERLLQLSK